MISDEEEYARYEENVFDIGRVQVSRDFVSNSPVVEGDRNPVFVGIRNESGSFESHTSLSRAEALEIMRAIVEVLASYDD